jgi:Mannosidase Ig/CBM-like domain/Ig-fold domain
VAVQRHGRWSAGVSSISTGRAPATTTLKREFAPIHIRANYDQYWFDPGDEFDVDVHGINDTSDELAGHTAVATLIDLDGRVHSTRSAALDVPRNNDGGASHAFTAELTAPDDQRQAFLLHLELEDAAGERIADNVSWFTTEPGRLMYSLAAEPAPELATAEALVDGARRVTITNEGDRSAFSVELRTDGYARMSDNFVHLMPGQSREITLTTTDSEPYLGGYSLVPLASERGAQTDSDNLALFKLTYASIDD